ncbi:MAG: hypothetical protein PHP64_08805 [Actinomycetota bacterium]|nr:hypothetical protein [Actinomycetota bacterium]
MFISIFAFSTQKVAIISFGVLAWLFCAFSGAEFARANGGSYGFWLFIGILLGPVGLLFSYVYFRLTGERYRRYRHGVGKKSDIPEMVRCPGCGEWVPYGFKRCQFCGSFVGKKRR